MTGHMQKQKSIDQLFNKSNRASSIIGIFGIVAIILLIIAINTSVNHTEQLKATNENSIIKDGFNDEGLSMDGTYDTCSLYSAENFEKRLNDGEDLLGCIVSFKINGVQPDGFFGYTIWAGEHLNFISDDNKGVEANQEMMVKVREVSTFLGSYLIKYDVFERSE